MVSKSNQILYLDDEQQLLELFAINFSSEFDISITTDYLKALKVIQKNEIKVVLSDQRMPNITGIEFIKQINKDFPDIICILISGYADKDVLFKSINEIDIFRFEEKPVQFQELKHTIEKAIEKYDTAKEKQKLESELKKALKKAQESDRLKTEFLSSLSHEIRTPANGIVGFTSLVKESKEKNITSEHLQIISESALRLVDIIDDMVHTSRLNAGEININHNEIFLNELLDDVYNTFLPEIGHNASLKFKVNKRKGKTRIPITTDTEKLYNIFIHLLRNAIKFTKSGLIEFGVYDEQNMIMFVRDSGIGISDSDKPIIFDFFTQGKQKHLSAEIDGIGLGLSIVKELVDLLNGEIWFETEKDKGSAFYFTFQAFK